MADITMCSGKDREFGYVCPLRDNCYRYKARKSFWQSYFMIMPFQVKEMKCDHYWELKEPRLR